jgi:hypothetical protein
MKLTDLAPRSVTFEAQGTSLTFRPFIVRDDIKVREICADQSLEQVLTDLSDAENPETILKAFNKIMLMAWFQLDIESQRKINDSRLVFIDPLTGNEQTEELAPIEKFKELFNTHELQADLFANFLRCRGLNIPELKDAGAIKEWGDQLMALLASIGR